MKNGIIYLATLFCCQHMSTGLCAQSRPDLQHAVYIESTTGKKFTSRYIDSVFALGTIAYPDSTKIMNGVPCCYVRFLDIRLITDLTKRPFYQENIGKNIYTSPGAFACYRQLNKDSLTGKVCLLHFWATTCGPCVRSLAECKQVFHQYLSNDQIRIFHFSQENEALVDKFLEKYAADHFPGSFINSADQLFSALKIEGIPTLFVVDRAGVITDIFTGQGDTIDKIRDAVQNALK